MTECGQAALAGGGATVFHFDPGPAGEVMRADVLLIVQEALSAALSVFTVCIARYEVETILAIAATALLFCIVTKH